MLIPKEVYYKLREKIGDKDIIGFPYIKTALVEEDLSYGYLPWGVIFEEFTSLFPEFTYTRKGVSFVKTVKYSDELLLPSIIKLPKNSLIRLSVFEEDILEKEKIVDVAILPFMIKVRG